MKEFTATELTAQDAALVEKARKATLLSYSPYSHFSVGAAVLLENGEVVCGGNYENASYPVGVCAERSAIVTAQNLHPGVAVTAIALAARGTDGMFTTDSVTPCGLGRQTLAECEKRYHKPVRILMTGKDKTMVADNINELLPLAFE